MNKLTYPTELTDDLIGQHGRQAAKSLVTRNRIVKSVMSLIQEGGYGAASSSAIAKRAGLTWGAVQHHFGSKDDILEEIIRRSYEVYVLRLRKPALREGSPEQRIALYIAEAWEHYQGEIYLSAIEILMASRGVGRIGSDLAISSTRSVLLEVTKEVFFDAVVADQAFVDVIYSVHCLLTGMLVESALEPETFAPERQLSLLKTQVKSILYAT